MRIAILSLFVLTFSPVQAGACPGGKSASAQATGAAGDVGKTAAAPKKGDCAGCKSCPSKAAAAASAKGSDGKVGEVTIGQLVDMRNHGGKIAILDANGDKTRAKFGMIPGALALSCHKSYDVSKELPQDKSTTLVFYCASKKCGASKVAADRAKSAGYTRVVVLPAGIKGWSEAGQKTTPGQS